MRRRLRMLEKKEYAAQLEEMIEKQLRRRGVNDAAVLSRLAKEVCTIERRPELASSASATLARLGYWNAHVHCGDGTLGLPELAPFDAILVAAAAPAVPKQGWRRKEQVLAGQACRHHNAHARSSSQAESGWRKRWMQARAVAQL